MTTQEFLKLSWKQYLVLEADFAQTERYISFEVKNMRAYSQEYIKQLQAICGEIDVQCKQYCKVLDTSYSGDGIRSYANTILSNRPDIKNAVIICGDLQLKPWEEWSSDVSNPYSSDNPLNVSPTWWRDYNKVKHERLGVDENGDFWYTHANLENVIKALAALYVICMNYYKELAESEGKRLKLPTPNNTLFKYQNWQTDQFLLGDCVFIGK